MDEKQIYISKIKEIMDVEGMNNSVFSAETGINIASLSQILNGHNMPSLKVLQNIKNRFPYVNADWLFLDKGKMRAEISQPREPLLPLYDNISNSKSGISGNNSVTKNVSENLQKQENQPVPKIEQPKARNIKRITVYFDDNSWYDFYQQ